MCKYKVGQKVLLDISKWDWHDFYDLSDEKQYELNDISEMEGVIEEVRKPNEIVDLPGYDITLLHPGLKDWDKAHFTEDEIIRVI